MSNNIIDQAPERTDTNEPDNYFRYALASLINIGGVLLTVTFDADIDDNYQGMTHLYNGGNVEITKITVGGEDITGLLREAPEFEETIWNKIFKLRNWN